MPFSLPRLDLRDHGGEVGWWYTERESGLKHEQERGTRRGTGARTNDQPVPQTGPAGGAGRKEAGVWCPRSVAPGLIHCEQRLAASHHGVCAPMVAY